MKALLSCLLLLFSGLLTAQTIENPTFKARNGSIRNITRIERTPECTKVHIHAIFRPKWWIMESGDSYLEDAATGKRYAQTGAEGIELKKETYMPDSGTMDFVLLFEPLPADIRAVHLIAPNSKESNTYDISLIAASREERFLNQVKGNWFAEDAQGSWAYGIYDSLVIMNNRLYDLKECRKKGKWLRLEAQSRTDSSTVTLQLTPRKDGSCLIALDGGKPQRYVRTRPDVPAMEADNGYGDDFFRSDSVCLQGYLNGYDPRLGFDSGILYLANEIIRQEYPTVVPIRPDGSFQCTFLLQHPVCKSLNINDYWIPFYAEPGDTVTLYLDWEDLLASSRARDRDYPLTHTAYMGNHAGLSHLATTLNTYFKYPYDRLSQAQKTLTPAQFQEELNPIADRWKLQADSLCRLYAPSQKAASLIRNHMNLKRGEYFLDFQMMREFYAMEDSTNQALKVQPDASYYHFLKEMPLNEPSALADPSISSVINRFEYMTPLSIDHEVYKIQDDEAFQALPLNEKILQIQLQLLEKKRQHHQLAVRHALAFVLAGSLRAQPALFAVRLIATTTGGRNLPQSDRKDAYPSLPAPLGPQSAGRAVPRKPAEFLPAARGKGHRHLPPHHRPARGQAPVHRLLGHHLWPLPGRHTGNGRPAQAIPQSSRVPVCLHHQRNRIAREGLYGLCGETSERRGQLPPDGHGIQVHAPALPVQRHSALCRGGERRQHFQRECGCLQPVLIPETAS